MTGRGRGASHGGRGSMADVVTEEDRTTLAPGWWLRVGSVLHSVTMCLTMDTGSCGSDANFVGETCTVRRYKLRTRHQE